MGKKKEPKVAGPPLGIQHSKESFIEYQIDDRSCARSCLNTGQSLLTGHSGRWQRQSLGQAEGLQGLCPPFLSALSLEGRQRLPLHSRSQQPRRQDKAIT